MSKDIVVCCDGTNGQFGKLTTNVAHLYHALAADGPEQISFYEPGVGTFGARVLGINVGKTLGKILGAAFGYGMQQNLVRAYRFIVEVYQPGDRLFVFGFSRGAFTARILAAMVDAVGVLDKHERDQSKATVKAYLNSDGERASAEGTYPTSACAPYFVGVWETVAALGLLLRLRRFHNNRLSPGVTRAVQALAIDERRRPFKPALWDKSALKDGQSIDQVWFVGVHSDVGGGYAKRGLADVTLHWMLTQAEAAGLALSPDAYKTLQPDPCGRLHHSYRGLWRLLGEYVRHPGTGANFAPSVATRLTDVPGYDPENLPASIRKAARSSGHQPRIQHEEQ